MDDRARAASWKTAVDRSLHNPRAEELRAQWLQFIADGITPNTDINAVKAALAATVAIRDAQRAPRPRGPFFGS